MKMFIVMGVYTLMSAYVMLRTGLFVRRNLPSGKGRLAAGLMVLLCGMMAAILPVSYFLPQGGLHRALLTAGNAAEGFIILLLFAYLLLELACLLLCLLPAGRRLVHSHGPRKLALGVLVWAVCACTWAYGTVHASRLTVRHYDVQVNKACEGRDSLRVVLVADLHLGNSVGAARVQDMVRIINEQDADLVLVAGDIFDNAVDEMDDPQAVREALRSMESRLGAYACWGNHDVRGRLFSGFSVEEGEAARGQEMDDFVAGAGIVMLADEAILLDDAFWLVGRKDYENDGTGERNREPLEVLLERADMDKPILVVDHEPRLLQQNADAGVDVLFSGHTHDGQTFPLSLGINLKWENPSGMLTKGSMTSIVTSGVGVYGPNMRVGTDADVTVVDITFARK